MHDDQLFYVRTDSQLTDVVSVTSLLQNIASNGDYLAVFSLDFQALSPSDTVLAKLQKRLKRGRKHYMYNVAKLSKPNYKSKNKVSSK